jgi:hypothetical protein
MRLLILLLLFCFVLSITSVARIGETPEQLEKRYGAPSKMARDDRPGMTVGSYSHGGVSILVSFVNGISSAEYYRKENGGKFSDHEIEVILEANRQTSAWKQTQSEPGGRNWVLADGSVQALYTEVIAPPTLGVVSSSYIKFVNEHNRKEESDKLKDF